MNDKYYEHDTPAAEWAEQSTKHALDELFNATYAYRSSKEFYNLIQFVRSFRFYSPYNAFLITSRGQELFTLHLHIGGRENMGGK